MILLHVTPTIYPIAEAEALAALLNTQEDEGWAYIVRTDPLGTGKAIVIVFDDEGYELGPL